MQEISKDTLAGCGRNDYVAWPAVQPAHHWKCFNCRKEFDLSRKAGH